MIQKQMFKGWALYSYYNWDDETTYLEGLFDNKEAAIAYGKHHISDREVICYTCPINIPIFTTKEGEDD